MPEIPLDKLFAFVTGAGGTTLFLWVAWYFLQRQERDANSTRARADAFGAEMYNRWEKCDHCLTRWKSAYMGLWHDCPAHLQAKHPSPESLEED
jgi:hypothetical protein